MAFILATIFTFQIDAQESYKRRIGISATIQESQFGFLMPIWVSQKFSIAPAIDFKYAEKIGTDYTLGVIPKFYINTEKIAPYFNLKIGAMINNPSSDNQIGSVKTTDWIMGLGFGGEYFIDERFSFGVELQGNFTKSDTRSQRFGNPGGLNFNLSSLVSVNLYF